MVNCVILSVDALYELVFRCLTLVQHTPVGHANWNRLGYIFSPCPLLVIRSIWNIKCFSAAFVMKPR